MSPFFSTTSTSSATSTSAACSSSTRKITPWPPWPCNPAKPPATSSSTTTSSAAAAPAAPPTLPKPPAICSKTFFCNTLAVSMTPPLWSHVRHLVSLSCLVAICPRPACRNELQNTIFLAGFCGVRGGVSKYRHQEGPGPVSHKRSGTMRTSYSHTLRECCETICAPGSCPHSSPACWRNSLIVQIPQFLNQFFPASYQILETKN